MTTEESIDSLVRPDRLGRALTEATGDERWMSFEASLISGGKSNLTFELTSPAGALILRRPPSGDLLPSADALAFLTNRLGAQRLAAEPDATRKIIDHCAGLPLALAIVAARAAIHPNFSLASIAAELRDSHGSLDAFTVADTTIDVRDVFSWSYHMLPPEAARLFRLLALHPGPDIATPAVASLVGSMVVASTAASSPAAATAKAAWRWAWAPASSAEPAWPARVPRAARGPTIGSRKTSAIA